MARPNRFPVICAHVAVIELFVTTPKLSSAL